MWRIQSIGAGGENRHATSMRQKKRHLKKFSRFEFLEITSQLNERAFLEW
jgi:hypothetical protein